MANDVLYRKWRPSRFSNIVGQGPITQTLTQAIANNRTSHAYLLCGPRGTGKTSTARVVAKALNCTMRPPAIGDPCSACNNCTAIETGSFIDVIEVDAASNRRIEEMRELREKVRFSPTAGHYKVYIIDEVHQLTDAASEAFLKTLEEPPPQTVFILATTEPHKLSPTILSRCQRFDFRKISITDMVDHLKEIATHEGVDIPPEALRIIAQTAKGSLRDGTNILDQLITSFGSSIRVENARELLGLQSEDRAMVFVKHLLTGSTPQALETINSVSSEGHDLQPFQQMTIALLRAALLEKTGVADTAEFSKDIASQLSFIAESVSLSKIMNALRLFNQFRHEESLSGPLLFELAIVELELASKEQPASPGLENASANNTPQAIPPQSTPKPRPVTQPPSFNTPPTKPFNAVPPSNGLGAKIDDDWKNFITALKTRVPKRQFDVAALVRSSKSHELNDAILTISFSTKSNSERLEKELEHPPIRIEVEKILEEIYGKPINLKIESVNSTQSSQVNGADSHLVRAAINLYQGHVISKNTIETRAENLSSEEPQLNPVDQEKVTDE
tara:strand:- start:97 stop:1782 length:1686 start_codon:yes stop_codon:yes gene_type:complete